MIDIEDYAILHINCLKLLQQEKNQIILVYDCVCVVLHSFIFVIALRVYFFDLGTKKYFDF